MDTERYERFEREVAELSVGTATRRERRLGQIGIALAIAGPVLGVIAYIGSLSADGPLGQGDMIVLGLLGVSVTVLGVGLFARYSVVRFFRFWAARIVYELASTADRADADDAH